jgi:Zn-dependent protease
MARIVHIFRQVMKWSWKLGRFAGIDTYVHATFLLLVGWAAWASYAGAGTVFAAVLGVAFLLAVFGSVLLHELGHALVARRYGIRTRKIVLSPIGGLAQLDGMPAHPRQELAVALAGPAVNFVLAGVLFVIGSGLGTSPMYGLLDGLVFANLTLGAFNLVPAFPMDGGRALRAFLATRMGNHNATEIAARVGKVVAIAMGIIGLATNWVLVAIAVFVWFAASAELRAAREEREWELLERANAWDQAASYGTTASPIGRTIAWPSDWLRSAASVRPAWRPEPRAPRSAGYPAGYPAGYRVVVVAAPRPSWR